MLKVKIECRDAVCEKIAKCLVKLGKSGFKIWLYNGRVFACFKLRSVLELSEFTKRLKRQNIDFVFHRIQKVWI